MRPGATALAVMAALALPLAAGGEEAMDFGGEDPEEPAAPSGLEALDELVPSPASEPSPDVVVAPRSEEPPPFVAPPPIWAVQRVYALRYHRWEIVPRFGFSLNDQFVSHYGFGGQVNWYVTEVLAIGLEGQWFYWNPESDINYYTSRSFRVVVPINEYWMGWYLSFHYVPMYGKFALWNRWIVHWDVFVSGGLGVTLTRPIAVVDAEFRSFDEYSDYSPNITFSVAIGGRTFLTRWLAIFAELRLYGFPQPLEERRIAPLGDPCPAGRSTSAWCDQTWGDQRANPATWLDEDGEFAVNVMAEVGLSFFLPPTFEYRLPL